MWLAAGQTQSAIVTVYIPPNAQIGDKDKITFTSQGIGLASQAATLTVTSATAIQVRGRNSDESFPLRKIKTINRTLVNHQCGGVSVVVVKEELEPVNVLVPFGHWKYPLKTPTLASYAYNHVHRESLCGMHLQLEQRVK